MRSVNRGHRTAAACGRRGREGQERPGPAVPASLDRLHERLFVAGYGRVQASSEAAGMREIRGALVAEASGRVLELGAGTGLNLEHYGRGVGELVLLEPAVEMRAAMQAAVADAAEHRALVVDGTGESVPYPDRSFDTIVGTFVLCSVADPRAVLREVARLLRPGGTYLGLEHVRAPTSRTARAQRALAPVWRWCARGCRCNQDAVALVEASPLVLRTATPFRGPRQPWPVRPGIRIVAGAPGPLGA